MYPGFPVKDEFPGASSSSSWQYSSDEAAAAAEDGVAPPPPQPFLAKTYDMVDDSTTAHIVSWSRGGHSFVVWDLIGFSNAVLPRYFKHKNFSSFVRQLNTYGFRKVDPDAWEFANEAFVRGEKHLLLNIRRRRAAPQATTAPRAVVELGQFGEEAEIDQLRRDKQVLMAEISRLGEEQQRTRSYLQQMELRLQGAERMQRQTMRFLAQAMQNPKFIRQLVRKKNEAEEAAQQKRLRPAEDGETSRRGQPVDEFGFPASELEVIPMGMQGLGKAEHSDVGFWEGLLNQGFDGDGVERMPDSDEDVNVLADRLGFLGSNSGELGSPEI